MNCPVHILQCGRDINIYEIKTDEFRTRYRYAYVPAGIAKFFYGRSSDLFQFAEPSHPRGND